MICKTCNKDDGINDVSNYTWCGSCGERTGHTCEKCFNDNIKNNRKFLCDSCNTIKKRE